MTHIPFQSLPDAIHSLLERGRQLEANRSWAEALTLYEEAMREYPNDASLLERYDLAKLHFSLGRRYEDDSFCQTLNSLSTLQAKQIYSDVLLKIQSHYVTTPAWRNLVVRGTKALDIALANNSFLAQNNLSRKEPEELNDLRRKLYEVVGQYRIQNRYDASVVVDVVARYAHARIGLNPSTTYLEYAASAAEGLDHYSAFLTPSQLKDIYSQIEGNFVGLGVELKVVDGGLLILDVIPGSPAQEAGILSGDRIIEVDGRPTIGLTIDEAASLLTGVEGSIAQLIAVTSDQPPRPVAVRRQYIEVPSIEDARIIDSASGIAYIRLPTFQKSSSQDLDAALWDLYHKGMRSLILDLRGNPGGLLTASVEVADKFITQGGIVSTRGRNPMEDYNYSAHREGTWRVPLVVLIDGNSASASEILAGAIRDSHRGTLIGERSYGKGSVQGIFPLGTTGSGLRLTTAKFYSPSGRAISQVGIHPDIVVRQAAKPTTDPQSTSNAAKAAQDDAALNAAVQAARQQIASR
ncbi:MAG: S41 family peptidase [Pirellulales bacterium]|nr:S41 family peptidase [Pirellulales bacterium]